MLISTYIVKLLSLGQDQSRSSGNELVGGDAVKVGQLLRLGEIKKCRYVDLATPDSTNN
jgi:hypothetical protein